MRRSSAVVAFLISAMAWCAAAPAAAAEPTGNRLAVRGEQILLNGEPIKIIGLRCSNALISDQTTQQLIDNLDAFKGFGVNTVSVFFMGSRFGDVKGYRPDGSLDPACAARMGRIIEAADARGMIVLVGCLYWSTSRASEDLQHWKQADACRAVANTIAWLKAGDYRNIFVDVDNEGMARAAHGWSTAALIDAAHAVDPTIMVAYNDRAEPPANADILIHFSPKSPGRPWLQSEGTPTNAPGGYWGAYSKQKGLYNYINIGVYTDAMKANQCRQSDDDIKRHAGHMLASTWLQCVVPHGPQQRPGGVGSAEDPGIRWWLEHVKATHGPWKPPAVQKVEKVSLSLVADGAAVQKLGGDFRFTEGPAAHPDGSVFFTDIPNKVVYRWSPADGIKEHWRGQHGIGGLFFREGRLLATCAGATGILDVTDPANAKVLVDRYDGKPLNGPNDLWVAPDGSAYFTDPQRRESPPQDGGYVYRLAPDGRTLSRVTEDLERPNGIVGSGDGKTLYVAVPKHRKTYAYDVRSNGTLANRRVAAPEPSDGLALDEQGNLYITWQVVKVYGPSGDKIGEIAFPEEPANVTFAGLDGRTLFVTARKGVYAVEMKVRGTDVKKSNAK